MSYSPGSDRVVHQNPASLGCGTNLFLFGAREPGQGRAHLVDGGNHQRHLLWVRSQALWRAGGLRGAGRGRPVRVGVGQPAGPLGQVTGFGGGAGDPSLGIGADVVERVRDAEPG